MPRPEALFAWPARTSMMRRWRFTAGQSSRAISALRIPANALIARTGMRCSGAAWMIWENSSGVKIPMSESGLAGEWEVRE
jgi:hypothetical protein